MRDAFEEGTSVDAVRADLETAREAAKKLQGSCGWATREAADGVLDVLDAAADGLQRGCPTALEVTLDAIDRLAARRGDAEPAAARYGRRVELAANAGSAARRTSPRASRASSARGAASGRSGPTTRRWSVLLRAPSTGWATRRVWATSSRARGGNLMLNDKLFTSQVRVVHRRDGFAALGSRRMRTTTGPPFGARTSFSALNPWRT